MICAFDIECTEDQEHGWSFMYIWQFQYDDVCTIYGRTWKEFREFIQLLSDALEDDTMVIWIHNLSYEFQYLKTVLNFNPEDIFAMDERKILKATYGQIEFRCSYLQTNLSLASLTNKYDVKHKKLSGDEFNYDRIRYPWTALSDRELEYCINDVRGLVEAMRYRINGEGYNYLPLTSTGYVRREVKRSMHQARPWLRKILPDEYVFTLLSEAFRGGNTHANRQLAGRILHNVVSYDRSSSYPDVMCNRLFPMSAWIITDPVDWTIDYLEKLIFKRKRACLFRVRFWNLKLNKDQYFPYISKHKCRNVIHPLIDNGRVLYAEYLETTVTDVDFRIIINQYEFDDIAITDLCHSRYGKLPDQITDIIKKYYRDKTELKGIPGQEESYFKAKELLNSIYGMTVQSPVKQDLIYDPIEHIFTEDNKSVSELLEKTYRTPYQSYAWGVWTTCLAREELQKGIDIAGERAAYVDTDSVKIYIGDNTEYEKIIGRRFSAINRKYNTASVSCGASACDKHGTLHYMGSFELDGQYSQFKTLGSKKYAYIDTDDNELHITVSGVNKKRGAAELSRSGGLAAFNEGYVFHDTGKTDAKYHDEYYGMHHYPGGDVEIVSNVELVPVDYTLGIAGDYAYLLQHPEYWFIDN